MRINSKLTTNSKSISYKVTQQKVLNWTSKGRLLEANWASFARQLIKENEERQKLLKTN